MSKHLVEPYREHQCPKKKIYIYIYIYFCLFAAVSLEIHIIFC